MCLEDRGSVPFIGFLIELFKRHNVHIPVDLIRIELEKLIDRIEFDTRMTSLEEQSGHHTTMLQEIKGMLIRMQSKDDDEDDE
ncbi:hypothetical protein Acr_26g0000830 [Actinidia rufa]|uniref:Uncharacterized protein n=1 Tax=Actinidia rufa TaxID=165716 RepID=A0A7J0H154_9ERIC|nr:hypothetical protein Acr_26g0000830 [Actinidia rufa]